MIDFPSSPTVGQQFTAAGVTWTWDGTKWTASGLGVAYLPLAGGTMLGPIALAADPAAPLQAATKQYVDGARWGDNRIINGDMRIDQRGVASGGGGTALTYTVDRWQFSGSQASKGTWSRGLNGVATSAFPYALYFLSNSAYSLVASDYFAFQQNIEADMVSDFVWGTAAAQPVTLSFWVYSSQTGTFGGALRNYAGSRSYPFTYSLPTANTWTKIVLTIPGDTGGTWVISGNAASIMLTFGLGCGATYSGVAGAWSSGNYVSATGAVSIVSINSAGFLLTGVKLEIGSVATPFNRQSLAKSLADCQRYYNPNLRVSAAGYTSGAIPGQIIGSCVHPITMRATPTITSLAGSNGSNISNPVYGPGAANTKLSIDLVAAGMFWIDYFFSASAEL